MRTTAMLRRRLAQGAVCAASVFDPLSARIAELAGFEALHLSGFAVEASQIGAPDMGLTSLSELVAIAGRITATVDIPVLADIDTGFGGANNVARTIREMERAGVAGVHIEDQVFPKRCPVIDGRSVLSREAGVARVAAALDARRDADFVIVARSDGDVRSIDEVIERCNLYLRAGADMAMPSFLNVDGRPYATLSPDEQMALYRRLRRGIEGPIMSMGFAPPAGYTLRDLADAGFAFSMIAVSGVVAAASSLAAVYASILRTGSDAEYFADRRGAFDDPIALMRALRLDEYVERDRRFTPPPGDA